MIGMMTCAAPTALDGPRAHVNQLLIECALAGPTAAQIAEQITGGRKSPLPGSDLFMKNGLLLAVFDAGGAGENSGFGIHRVAQPHVNFAGNILEQDL